MGDPLPLGLLSRIQSVAGVRYVSPRINIVGNYRKPGEGVLVVGVDPAVFFQIYNEWLVPREQVEALRNDRTGVIVGAALMKRYGWKVGERIALQSPMLRTDGSAVWTFEVVGAFDVPDGPAATIAVANFTYVNESRLSNRDRANLFVARIDNAANAAAIGLAIDNVSANSDHETRTQSEADVVTTQIQRIADLDFIVRGIISAVFFALLLATGALMMQSIRERIAGARCHEDRWLFGPPRHGHDPGGGGDVLCVRREHRPCHCGVGPADGSPADRGSRSAARGDCGGAWFRRAARLAWGTCAGVARKRTADGTPYLFSTSMVSVDATKKDGSVAPSTWLGSPQEWPSSTPRSTSSKDVCTGKPSMS
jgi:hypothetical protein